VDYKAEFESECKVQDKDGKKTVQMLVPVYFQGHTFAVDFSRPGTTREEGGPYRVEFVLSSDFLIYRSDIKEIDLDQGHSNLEFGESMAKVKLISLHYLDTGSGQKKDAPLTFRTDGLHIQRFIVQMPENGLDMALRVSGKMVNQILDAQSFQKQVPLQIRQIEIFHEPSGELLRRYATVPYTANKDLDVHDFEFATRIPKSLKPILRIYREAINSSNPHYRFLCLYRMHEGLQKIQTRNNEEVVAKGNQPKRTRLRVPDNELTKKYFQSLVGKKFNAFLDYVRTKYRINIAHLNFDDFDRMLLDPSEVENVHRIDCTNAVLEQMMRQSVINELSFMQEHGLQ